jgi:hypothetical protein
MCSRVLRRSSAGCWKAAMSKRPTLREVLIAVVYVAAATFVAVVLLTHLVLPAGGHSATMSADPGGTLWLPLAGAGASAWSEPAPAAPPRAHRPDHQPTDHRSHSRPTRHHASLAVPRPWSVSCAGRNVAPRGVSPLPLTSQWGPRAAGSRVGQGSPRAAGPGRHGNTGRFPSGEPARSARPPCVTLARVGRY